MANDPSGPSFHVVEDLTVGDSIDPDTGEPVVLLLVIHTPSDGPSESHRFALTSSQARGLAKTLLSDQFGSLVN